MSSLIPAVIGMGQRDAQNPGINFGNIELPGNIGLSSYLSHADPLGNEITKLGGDPLNLYGNKNNPNALLFPSSNPNAGGAGVPSVLPTLPGVGAPKTYSPNSFGSYANLGSGPFNQMASQMAGPMYSPQLMPMTPVSNSNGRAVPSVPAMGKGGAGGFAAAPVTLRLGGITTKAK
jgi:hypothetical protein